MLGSIGRLLWKTLLTTIAVTATAWAADPEPSKTTTTLLMPVFNPVTNSTTAVQEVILDPPTSPTPTAVAFIRTTDGYIFLVKDVGELIYNNDIPPASFKIVSQDINTKTVELQGIDPPSKDNSTVSFSYQLEYVDFQTNFLGEDTPGTPTLPVLVSGLDGVRSVLTGSSGSNGRSGALFVPPRSGGDGGNGPANSYTTSFDITAADKIGLEVGSQGGRGGSGGNSYASFWNGRSGGDGGAGGTVVVINNTGVQIGTTGTESYGIFAFSRSGRAGNGGSGYAAPGGGTGGHSSDGGDVTVTNRGTVVTNGSYAHGIYALSVSNNGGNGGDTWGLVGQSGAGNHGGNGGTVSVTNAAGGVIFTQGNVSHGILAQSIGGSGGSSGTSGNLLLSLNGSADNGGDGGQVDVFNYGDITTTGVASRGILAQSIGGGGGSGGSSGGLFALGGAGSNGGSSGAVTVKNFAGGTITTTNLRSDAIMAQSIGGSGGGGSNAGGLVAVGGSGSVAGHGGTVTVENYGTIITQGDFARGIVAQSIGGGGGDGGNSGGMISVGGGGSGGGAGDKVTVKHGGSIETGGTGSFGIFAQSVGGGGGNGGSAGSVGLFAGVAVGGDGSSGGVGGEVEVLLQGQSANTASLIHTGGDRSTALFAQSIGGGGGNGGGSFAVSAGFGAAASFAIGGQGGAGGAGGAVTLSKGAGISIIETGGNDSTGVFLQSVGGGGGNGGYAIALSGANGEYSGSLSLAIGGDGGSGGVGGNVTVGSFAANRTLTDTGFNGSILTMGDRSTGFLAQSVGGGGGNGGLAVAGSVSLGATLSGSISIGLGGDGAGGGSGGIVKVGTQGNITTEGDSSTAMLVQSVGGGGGNGGGSVAASFAGGGIGAGALGISIGGDAGQASHGGEVTVATRSGTITTKGAHSTGIVVQSVGGGGGNGGFAVSAGAAGAGVGAGAVNLGLGGTGGGGGNGGSVKADLQSNVTTSSVQVARAQDPVTGDEIPEHYAANSGGILVQSVGGGGGNGGFSVAAGGAFAGKGSGAVSVGLGGSGATGGTGGRVEVTSTGQIQTMGDRSAGFVAQSIGGGGGSGGYSVSVAGAAATVGSGAINVGLGGSGGAGNHGGQVVAETSVGKVTTKGADSVGILAQSVGGGGGNGGYNVGVAASGAGGGSGAISVGLGGNGAGGGNADTVELTVRNAVSTAGKNSAAVVAQAIGGGGGNGGYNVSASGAGAGSGSGAISVGLGGSGGGGGSGANVTALVTGNIDTGGENSAGILAQSVGGGGGNGGYNVSLAGAGSGGISGAVSVGLGGSGGTASHGMLVDLTSQGTIHTTGDKSTAFIAQSIGGGGGNGGFNVSVALSGAGSGSGAVSVGLGGGGAGGGNGGIVIASTSGNILTEGDKSGGILAQSVGGGGGNGGFDVSVSGSIAGSGSGAVSVGIGGSGAGGGTGSHVSLTVNNNVTTKGKKATGIIAQSMGGGGGNGGFDVTAPISASNSLSGAIGVSIGGSAGAGGGAGVVISDVTGMVVTEDEGSGGMLAQSVGGGGGSGGMSIVGALSFSGSGAGAVAVGIGGSGGGGGTAGNVTSTLNGSVYTGKNDSFGVIAQSLGGGGGSGGLSVSGTISLAQTGSGAVAFGLGGFGGLGGDAAEVRNTITGYVQTAGKDSVGVLAQSLGGGGGHGGLNVTGSITASNEGSDGLAIGIGGFGGGGGDGKLVINQVTGGVRTGGNDSAAIVAQSLGGGGGNGGLNVTGTINATKETGGTLGIGVGGFGGGGGDSGRVESTVVATSAHGSLIGTLGNNSSAVVAQSIAGGGGNGGLNVTGAVNLTGQSGAAIGVGLGGFGGGGGNAGVVIADVTGDIITQGHESHGIVAQSIGGGGGNGGLNVTGTLAYAQSPATTAAVSLGVGGFGGSGGRSDAVTVSYHGTLTARPTVWVPGSGGNPGQYQYADGVGSNGIMAQSIGGGGGNGGLSVAGGVSYVGGTGHGYGVVVGVGGFGGSGGDAGASTVNVTGGSSITGYGTGHSAIVAQSLGGGGGNGGMNISGGITSDSGLLFGVGGFAGDAGRGTTVTVTSTTNVYASTLNANEDEISSAGILAQSIGGGGGNGGLNVTGGLAIAKQAGVPSVNFGVGGFGGAGASSGDVTVNHTGNAITSGNWVHGIMAQSIAGGGGNGGMNVGGQLNFASSENSGGNTDLSIIAGIGGNAGAGSVAGNVIVTNNGIVTTVGDHARGVAAQSIGGGGGTGGMNVTGVYAKNSNPITVGIGGTGGSGGEAGTATVIRGNAALATGKVTTDGVAAHAIEASSIGGGGGDAGMNFNVGYSTVGEGTATAGFAANFIIGGGGGTAASGNDATVTNYSAIETKQDKAYGILAQSIGGGGGNANFNIGVTHASASTSASAGGNLYNKPNQNMALSVAVGGATGDGGNGGHVMVTQVGDLTTAGKQAIGILAQSVGGGGGNAGLDVAFVKADGGKASITLGREGGTGGFGGIVELNYDGILNTTGEMAFGLLAQSIGNGGGNSSSTTVSGEIPSGQNDLGQTRPQSATVAIGLAGGQGGYGGAVTLNSQGSVTTRGKRAHGVFAQSIGGGGGNGGRASSFGITAPVVAITLGGTGGTGGYGGQVDLTNSATVETFGEEAVGILAQSIGGGGGNGGSTYAGGTKTGDTGITVGIGGVGGPGMNGGVVNVINDGIVVTHDLAAHGILAQSIGGGGGDGGSAISMLGKMHPSNPNATDSTRVAVNVGGNGGTGGYGDAVNVTNRGGIGTYEAASVGIFAQSIGGGGGNGRSVLSASLAGTSGNNMGINIGGSGGTGGTGGVVTVKNEKTAAPDSAKIITLGDKAHGILAMSVGGGGGTGSNVAAITRGTGGVDGTTTVTNVNFTMGGSGGTGGTGGLVDVVNEGFISTAGKAAHGIIAQSIGGGGGQGGMAISGDLAFGSKIPTGNDTYNVAIGGQGGAGEAGGEVKVNNSGTIHVMGDESYGIYAQSVGGGGGDGGFAAVFSRNLVKNPKDTLAAATSTFALGGFGGTGGDGGPVTVTHTGTIQADGDNAYGIFAQSVSGGGGNAAFSLSSPVWTVADFALKTIIGGGSAGTAGKVTLNTTGNIIMNGKNSVAFFSQSVNGGGGNVNQFMDFSQQAQGLGDNGLPLPGNGGDIDTAYAFLDSVITMGADAVFGVAGAAVEALHLGSFYSDGDNGGGGLLQSVGGGGGRGSQEIHLAEGSSEINLVVLLGGKDVSDSSGGNVTYSQTGGVTVRGDQSAGVTVQTIGGGGGVQFVTLRQVPQATPPPPPPPAFGPLALAAPPPPPGSPSVTLGADGGVNNHGGMINNAYSGAALTIVGDRSAGLLHQSIGAGGGAVYADLPGFIGLNAALGGYNGASGDGGDITVTNTRDVGTHGILSHAILFQSIGGGGGAIFTDLDPSLIAVALNTANTGNGGNIMLTQNGAVYALGERSTAVILQSLGGGGGMVDDVFAGAAGGAGNSGAVTLVMNGDVVATGTGGSGVFAQSQGSGTQGNITVTLAAGKNLYFGNDGTGVRFSGGAANVFANNGTVAGTQGVSSWAFRGEEGDDTVQNTGSFTGNADFGAGANAFENAANAMLSMGPQFFLGAAANTLTNAGDMHIGGTNLAQHTDMTGGFTQTSTGTTFAELDFGTDMIDNVSMTGAASFDGSIEVALLNPHLVPAGVFQKVLFHADGGVTNHGMDLVTAPSVVINYGLNYLPGGNDLALDYSVNFNPPGSEMSRNLVEVGAHINSIQNAGSSPSLAAVIIRLLYEPTMDGYRALLSQMGPDFYGEQQAEMLRGTQRFGETVLGGGSTRFMTHGRRIWFDVLGSSTFHGRFDDYKTTQQSTTGFALGYESLISRRWSAGLAVALEENMASGYEGRWSAEGTSQRVGGVVRFRSGGTEISGLLSYGWNQMDSSRVGQVTNPFDTNVERNIQTFTAMVRAAHQFGDEGFAVIPRVDVGVTRLSAQNATESGADALSLYLHDVQETHAWLRPAVTVRKAIPVFRQAKLRIQAEIGYQYFLTGNDTYVKGGLTGAPGGVDPMNVPIDLGSMATLSVGAQLLMANDLSIGLYYTKAFSEKYKVDLWNVRVNKEF